MGEQEKENHWEGLASELGADPKNHQAVDPEPVPEDLPVEFDAVPSSTAMPERSGDDWGVLAETFGIEVEENTETAAEDSELSGNEQVIEEVEVVIEEEVIEEEVIEAELASDESSRSAEREPRRRSRSGERRRGGRRRGGRRGTSEEKPAAEIAEYAGDMESIESAVDFSAEQESPEAAGEGTETPTDAVEAAGEKKDRVSTDDAESESEGDGRRRRRRRGRRGGRRGAARENDPGESTATAGTKDDRAAQEDEDEDEDAEQSPKRRPSHRNITTWEECVGVILSSNLESRSKSPKTTSSGGRGRGGRGRGGRGRGRGQSGKKEDKSG